MRYVPEGQRSLESLADDSVGCYVISTESDTRYWIHCDRRLVRRVPSPENERALRLRGDGEDLILEEIIQCRRGRPLLLLINLQLPGVLITTRESTPIIRIDPVPEIRGWS
jgi:hypothetical protein